MKKIGCSLLITLLVLFVGIVLLDGEAYAQLACYTWDLFPAFRFKLDIREHSLLSDPLVAPAQLVLSVHGKLVSAAIPATRPTTGTLVSTLPSGQPLQAHLSVLGSAAGSNLRDVHVSCKAGDAPGFPPPVWNCLSYNDFGVFHGASVLTLVSEADDSVCGTFVDGQEPTPAAQPSAEADPCAPAR